MLIPKVAPSHTRMIPMLVPIKRYYPSFEKERHVSYPIFYRTAPFKADPLSQSQTLKLLSLQIAISLLNPSAIFIANTYGGSLYLP